MVVFNVSNFISLLTTNKLLSKIPIVIKLQRLRGAFQSYNSEITASHFVWLLRFRISKDAVTADVISIYQCGFIYLYMVAD
jgi:hypothetical protein